jgi:osomolarity two-component system response regulator SSK1
MSALFTAMKNINYISANMSTFCDNARFEDFVLFGEGSLKNHNDFDIGELLQCLGDAMSGAAAQAGVDLVIYHEDFSTKHVYVSADESSISFALSHVCILSSNFSHI